MSKFRARQLDAAKPIPVYRQEDIPDYAEFNAINRTVPQMPTGMEKEDETVRKARERDRGGGGGGTHGRHLGFAFAPNSKKNIYFAVVWDSC